MFQLRILSGRQAGTTWVARRFPVRAGRAAGSDLHLDEAGVWDQHLLLEFKPDEGCVLTTRGEALASVNGEPVQRCVLHNGDRIQAGAAELQFWLSDARQPSLGVREAFTWLMILGVFVAQVVLLYMLVK